MIKQRDTPLEHAAGQDEQLGQVTKQLERLQHVKEQLDRVKLGGIHLLEAHCKLGKLLEKILPDNARQETHLDATLDEKRGAIQVVVTYCLTASYEPLDKIDENGPIFVRGRFLLNYSNIGDDVIGKLAETIQPNAVRDSWPFWRELVQSLTVRMGIPPFPVPLVNLESVRQFGSQPKPTRIRRKSRL